jgi:hypothetical protein
LYAKKGRLEAIWCGTPKALHSRKPLCDNAGKRMAILDAGRLRSPQGVIS